MASFLLLNILDVGRAFGFEPKRTTPEQIRDWLLTEYVRKRGGGFNYDPAIKALYDLFRGACSLDEALIRCATTGNPKGRGHNAKAIECVGPYALENISSCYRIDFTAVVVGRTHEQTIYVGMKAPMVRVRDERASVVLPGFRKGHRPVGPQIDLACSIALATLARDDFARADFEYLDTGAGVTDERELQVFRGRDRQVYSADEIDALLDVYVRGVALALDSGVTARDANLQGYRIIDPREPSLFM